jgi:endonuclease-3
MASKRKSRTGKKGAGRTKAKGKRATGGRKKATSRPKKSKTKARPRKASKAPTRGKKAGAAGASGAKKKARAEARAKAGAKPRAKARPTPKAAAKGGAKAKPKARTKKPAAQVISKTQSVQTTLELLETTIGLPVLPPGPPAPAKPAARAATAPTASPETRERARRILDGLTVEYPDAKIALDYTNALELLLATILAAQCTDERVNMVTKELFLKYRTPEDYVNAPDSELEEAIRSTGFFHNKAKAIKAACKSIIYDFGGEVPRTMDDLLTLPGVGRKTANVLLGNVFGVPGIVVDTHMIRLAKRMGLTAQTDADKIEYDLMKIFPEQQWTFGSHLIATHGRTYCTARNPQCTLCPVADDCPKLLED